jgi:hypothetical protein
LHKFKAKNLKKEILYAQDSQQNNSAIVAVTVMPSQHGVDAQLQLPAARTGVPKKKDQLMRQTAMLRKDQTQTCDEY